MRREAKEADELARSKAGKSHRWGVRWTYHVNFQDGNRGRRNKGCEQNVGLNITDLHVV